MAKKTIKKIIADIFENPQDYSFLDYVCNEYWREDEYEFNNRILDRLLECLKDEDFSDIFCLDGYFDTPKRKEIIINYIKNYKV